MAFLWFSRKPAKVPEPLPAVLPPETITDEKAYLKKVLGESRSVLDADLGGFEMLESRQGWSVHRKPVQGTKLTMVRLEADLPVRPDTLFALLTETMDGKRIIDPFPRERHSELLQKLRLPGGDAAVKFSEAPRFAGMLRPREYVTCDTASKKERLFVCKSCEVERGEAALPQRGRVRANLLFALRAQERKGQPGCHVQMINWLDLGPRGKEVVPAWVANAVTERWYMQGLMRRLQRYISQQGLCAATAPSEVQQLSSGGAR